MKPTLWTDHFTAEIGLSVNPKFFDWVVGFGGKMEIAAPENVKERYVELLQGIVVKAKRL